MVEIPQASSGLATGLGAPLLNEGAPVNGTDHVETLAVTGTPTGGDFDIHLNGAKIAIPWNASAANVITLLNASFAVDAGDIVGSGGALPGSGVVLTRAANRGKLVDGNITKGTNRLTGGTAPDFSITQTTAGVTATQRGAAKGAQLIDITNGVSYINVGTPAAPNWLASEGLASLDADMVALVANANVDGGIPILFRIDVADATGDTNVTMSHKVRVIDVWGLNTGIAAHAANDTWQVKSTGNAITDAVAKTATVNAVRRAATTNPANHEIAAGGVLRVSAVKDTNAAVTVYVLAVRVA